MVKLNCILFSVLFFINQECLDFAKKKNLLDSVVNKLNSENATIIETVSDIKNKAEKQFIKDELLYPALWILAFQKETEIKETFNKNNILIWLFDTKDIEKRRESFYDSTLKVKDEFCSFLNKNKNDEKLYNLYDASIIEKEIDKIGKTKMLLDATAVAFAKYVFKEDKWKNVNGEIFLKKWFSEGRDEQKSKFINLPLFDKIKKLEQYNIDNFIIFFQIEGRRQALLSILNKFNDYDSLNEKFISSEEFKKDIDNFYANCDKNKSNYFLTIGLPFAAIFAFLIYLFLKKQNIKLSR